MKCRITDETFEWLRSNLENMDVRKVRPGKTIRKSTRHIIYSIGPRPSRSKPLYLWRIDGRTLECTAIAEFINSESMKQFAEEFYFPLLDAVKQILTKENP